MAFYGAPSGAVFYRSNDPLGNLRIRATIRRVVLGGARKSLSESWTTFNGQQVDSHIFSWQEKIFSRRELQFYSDARSCISVHEKAYHEKVMSLSTEEKQLHGGRLFSRINSDLPSDYLRPVLTENPTVPETFLADRVQQFRPRKARIGDLNALQRLETLVVGQVPSARRIGSVPFLCMTIMADLSSPTEEPIEIDEHILCSIRIDKDGLIAIEPNFNSPNRPYLVRLQKSSREMYEYFIEHASNQMTQEDLQQELQLSRALYQRHMDNISSLIGNSFSRPKIGEMRMILKGEIESAEGFENDNIFVHFLLELTPEWKSKWDMGPEPVHYTSQICRRKKKKFTVSCPFSWQLDYSSKQNDSQNAYGRRPRLLFEIASLDSWNRYRIEGYGFLNVHFHSGLFHQKIVTWRPVGSSVISRLRRIFIGGCPELEDLSYIALPTDFEGRELSRYGLETTPSGTLSIKLDISSQSSGWQTCEYSGADMNRKFHKKRRTYADQSVENVLKAFQRARQRLLEVRGISPSTEKHTDKNEGKNEEH